MACILHQFFFSAILFCIFVELNIEGEYQIGFEHNFLGVELEGITSQ